MRRLVQSHACAHAVQNCQTTGAWPPGDTAPRGAAWFLPSSQIDDALPSAPFKWSGRQTSPATRRTETNSDRRAAPRRARPAAEAGLSPVCWNSSRCFFGFSSAAAANTNPIPYAQRYAHIGKHVPKAGFVEPYPLINRSHEPRLIRGYFFAIARLGPWLSDGVNPRSRAGVAEGDGLRPALNQERVFFRERLGEGVQRGRQSACPVLASWRWYDAADAAGAVPGLEMSDRVCATDYARRRF